MEIGHYVIAVGVAIVSILVSIFIIRIFANLLIICAFLAAIIVPVVFLYSENAAGNPVSLVESLLGTAGIAFLITLLTVPLWPVSSIMNWTGKKERDRIASLESKVARGQR